jgi:hypothetical protein
MRFHLALTLLFVGAASAGADDPPKDTRVVEGPKPPKATRVIEGSKTTFPAKSIPEGVKTLTGALESCHTMSDGTLPYTADDLKNAQKGDHVRFLFPKPLGVEVMRKKLEVSEAVFAKGVFWLLCGEEVVRCAKYEHNKMDRFEKWYRQTLPAD